MPEPVTTEPAAPEAGVMTAVLEPWASAVCVAGPATSDKGTAITAKGIRIRRHMVTPGFMLILSP